MRHCNTEPFSTYLLRDRASQTDSQWFLAQRWISRLKLRLAMLLVPTVDPSFYYNRSWSAYHTIPYLDDVIFSPSKLKFIWEGSTQNLSSVTFSLSALVDQVAKHISKSSIYRLRRKSFKFYSKWWLGRQRRNLKWWTGKASNPWGFKKCLNLVFNLKIEKSKLSNTFNIILKNVQF